MSLSPSVSAASGLTAATGCDFAATACPSTSGSAPRDGAASPRRAADDPTSRCGDATDPAAEGFADRRRSGGDRGLHERRQFGSSHAGLSPDARELAIAIDQYKLASRRRYITCEEMLAVITQLGYRRPERP